MTEAVKDVGPKYWGDVLAAFGAGVQLDLRVRLAIEFLKSPYFNDRAEVLADDDAQRNAAHALDLATAIIDEAAARGLVKDLPDTGEINSPMRRHIERSARAQAFGQVVGSRAMREESGVVAPAGASLVHPAMNG